MADHKQAPTVEGQVGPKRSCAVLDCQYPALYYVGEDYICSEHWRKLQQGARLDLPDGSLYLTKMGRVNHDD